MRSARTDTTYVTSLDYLCRLRSTFCMLVSSRQAGRLAIRIVLEMVVACWNGFEG